MKQNYKKTINIYYYYFLPSMNHFRFMRIQYICQLFCPTALLDSRSQFLTSRAIFNRCAYTQRVDQIIFYRSSSFSIYDVAFQGTLPMSQTLKPNTSTIILKLIWPKLILGMVDIVLQQLLAYPTLVVL